MRQLLKFTHYASQPEDGPGFATRISVRLLWEPRDFWIGAYFNPEHRGMVIYVCLLPFFPIRIHYRRTFSWEKIDRKYAVCREVPNPIQSTPPEENANKQQTY
jgi:hypothetical protein